ncbi:hypothetical protein [Pelagibius sp. Alg239-R121]|uniref:hypothetical protein n=1 Tax=Pelagibius sp. Alg239-R121 TaxID=2993448 RepID=UPI0024A75731|nr:hypothetical protein [Pelagibius sp. Alg239-R121]
MPRFPVQPQRTTAPAAFSTAPRAHAADFGGGVGRELAGLGAGVADLGAALEVRDQRRERQVMQAVSRLDVDVARQRAESDAQAPPEEDSDSRIKRQQAVFEASAAALVQSYEGQSLQAQLSERIDARRRAWTRRLVEGEASRRLHKDLQDVQAVVSSWQERIAADASQFNTASLELLGDGVSDDEGHDKQGDGQAGLLGGLGLRPEALAAWREHTLKQLLDARMAGDPGGVLVDLEAGSWPETLPEARRSALQEDAREALARQQTAERIDRSRQGAHKSLKLSQDIAEGKAGQAEVRRAEEDGALSTPQAEALRSEVAQAAAAAQERQAAQDELGVSLNNGAGFDAGNPQNRAAADDFYERVFSAAVREGAEDAPVAQVVSAVKRTGYLPKGLARDVTALLQGRDEAGQVAGAELYGQLLAAAPELVKNAIDLEARARGGVLKRWLDAGLDPADALQRTEAELPRDGTVRFVDDQEMAVLQRDLRALFIGKQPDRHVGRILGLLEDNYLGDLARGLNTRQARAQLRHDVGGMVSRVSLLRTILETRARQSDAADGVNAEGASLLQPAGFFSKGFSNSAGKGGLRGTSGFYGPFGNPLDDELAGATTQLLQKESSNLVGRLDETYRESNKELSRLRARLFPPYAAFFFGDALLSIGDGTEYLGKIVEEDNENDIRRIEIQHDELGRVTVRQQYDITTERYFNIDATFYDPDQRNDTTETFPNSRFFVPSP